jgi:cysteine desulfuration protein SufE
MERIASVADIQKEIVEEFSFFDNWEDKYSYIIDSGKNISDFPETYKTDNNKIKGCQSQVWLNSYLKDGKIIFEADSDATIVKGLIGLLIRILSHHTPDEIINADLYFLDKIGMSQHLSPSRSNGLAAMVKQMKLRSLAYKARMTDISN